MEGPGISEGNAPGAFVGGIVRHADQNAMENGTGMIGKKK